MSSNLFIFIRFYPGPNFWVGNLSCGFIGYNSKVRVEVFKKRLSNFSVTNPQSFVCISCELGASNCFPWSVSLPPCTGVAYTSECFPCKAGTYSSEPGGSRCAPCPANTYSRKGATACQECEKDKYSGICCNFLNPSCVSESNVDA